jgi:hypothetical protein
MEARDTGRCQRYKYRRQVQLAARSGFARVVMSSHSSPVETFYQRLNAYRLQSKDARMRANSDVSSSSAYYLISACEAVMQFSDWEILPERTRSEVLSVARDTQTKVPPSAKNKELIDKMHKLGWPKLTEEPREPSTHLP